jgi:acetyl-CoA carboxylase biotin carboxyl carrier protein
MNLKEIKELVDLITEKGISEFELERAGVRLRISRPGGPGVAQVSSSGHVTAARVPPVAEAPLVLPQVIPAPPPLVRAEIPPQAEGLYVVRSPMVGTFYSAPAQGSAPFVQVGDRVQAGQVLCIIEAMKLMNEIEAEIAGEVVACHVENGQPVEYGEQLFDLKPAGSSSTRS